jgi:hypothetical protein
MFVPLILEVISKGESKLKGITDSLTGIKNESKNASTAANTLNNTLSRKDAAIQYQQTNKEIANQREQLQVNSLLNRKENTERRALAAESIFQEKQKIYQTDQSAKSFAAMNRAQASLQQANFNASKAHTNYSLQMRQNNNAAFAETNKLAGATGKLPNIFDNLGGVAGRVLGSGGITGGLSASTLAVGALATGVGVGLVAAFQAASAAASFFGKEFGEAMDRQVESVTAAEAIVKNFKTSYDVADLNVRDTKERNAILGRDLPVSSGEINDVALGITDNLSRALAKAGKGIDELAEYQDLISSRGAIIAKTAGVGATQFNDVFNKLDAGATIGTIKKLEIYAQAPAFQAALEETFKKYNIENTKNLTDKQKPEFFKDLSNAAVSEEQIARLKLTASAQISSVYDQLFDPYEGLFGIERDIDKNKANGVQSVFTQLTRTLDILIGENGIVSNISKLLGGTTDPMQAIYNGLEGFNNWLTSVNKLLASFTETQQKIDQTRGYVQPAANILTKGFGVGTDLLTGNVLGAAQKSADLVGETGKALTNSESKGNKSNVVIDSIRWLLPFNSLSGGIGAKPSYTGHIPKAYNAADGFMPLNRAIAAELQNKPSNSELIIANSSEFVLKPEQLERMVAPSINTSTQSQTVIQKTLSIATGAINIVANASMDVSGLADAVIARIDERYNQEIEANLG